MVHGYSRTTSILRTSSAVIPSGVNRLLYQVDRSRDISKDHRHHGNELHLEKRHMSARFTLRNSNQQQTAIYLENIHGILQQVEDQD